MLKDLHINKEVLNVEKEYKYLGVILDSKLNFESQYKEMVKTFSFKLYLYRRIRNCLNDFAEKLILKTMVLSYLDYGSMFLTVRTIDDISTVQVLQNKALRACLRIRNYMDVPVHEIHLRLNVQPYDKRMQYFLLFSIYRNIKNVFLIPMEHGYTEHQCYLWLPQILTGFIGRQLILGYKPGISYRYI